MRSTEPCKPHPRYRPLDVPMFCRGLVQHLLVLWLPALSPKSLDSFDLRATGLNFGYGPDLQVSWHSDPFCLGESDKLATVR